MVHIIVNSSLSAIKLGGQEILRSDISGGSRSGKVNTNGH